MNQRRLRTAVVGATGLAGQQFLAALADHPWFEVTAMAASARSAGKRYREAIVDANGSSQWYAHAALPDAFANMVVQDAETFDPTSVDLVFTAIDAAPARELEPRYARHVPVISTASAFRYEEDVPLLLPGINPEHASLLRTQQQARGFAGFIAPNPNCTTVGLAYSLAPLLPFGIRRVHMVSMQSMSGAGRSPGVIGMDILDNLVPYIPKEEQKVQTETKKILGTLQQGSIVPATFEVTCTCTRVAVLEGHTEVVHVELDGRPTVADIADAWRQFGSAYVSSGLPSAPPQLLVVREDPFRPQPRLDRDVHRGMSTVLGRLRADENIAGLYKYVLVSHNTKMGAASGCILMAEQLKAAGVLSQRA